MCMLNQVVHTVTTVMWSVELRGRGEADKNNVTLLLRKNFSWGLNPGSITELRRYRCNTLHSRITERKEKYLWFI